VFICPGRGGFGYLKQWKWWAGLTLSKSSQTTSIKTPHRIYQPIDTTLDPTRDPTDKLVCLTFIMCLASTRSCRI